MKSQVSKIYPSPHLNLTTWDKLIKTYGHRKGKKCNSMRDILPSKVFLKLMFANLSMGSVSYSVRLKQNSTSADVGSLGVLILSWLPGLRRMGPSPVPLHKVSNLLYSSDFVQITCKKNSQKLCYLL